MCACVCVCVCVMERRFFLHHLRASILSLILAALQQAYIKVSLSISQDNELYSNAKMSTCPISTNLHINYGYKKCLDYTLYRKLLVTIAESDRHIKFNVIFTY
mgnify:FL=1